MSSIPKKIHALRYKQEKRVMNKKILFGRRSNRKKKSLIEFAQGPNNKTRGIFFFAYCTIRLAKKHDDGWEAHHISEQVEVIRHEDNRGQKNYIVKGGGGKR